MLLPITGLSTPNNQNFEYSNIKPIQNASNPTFCKLYKVKYTQEQQELFGKILGGILALVFIGLSCIVRPLFHFIQSHLG